jgi:hypothetical protein
VSAIRKHINSIWNKNELPDQWKQSITVSVHKKDDKTECIVAGSAKTDCVLRLLVTANIVPSSQNLIILMTKAISSSETPVPIRATWRNIRKTAFFTVTSVQISNLTW